MKVKENRNTQSLWLPARKNAKWQRPCRKLPSHKHEGLAYHKVILRGHLYQQPKNWMALETLPQQGATIRLDRKILGS